MLRPITNLKNYYFFHSKKGKVKHLPSFLTRISTLLNEGYTLTESIDMLLPYHTDNLNYWRNIIEEKLKDGAAVVDVLQCFHIPKQYLVTIKIAEESGTLVQALKTIANQLDFAEKMRKKLLKLLSYPLFLMIFITIIFIAFRTSFLPNITMILSSREGSNNDMVSISSIFLYLPDILFLSFIFVLFITIITYLFLKRSPISKRISILLKIPLINYFYKLNLTNQFSKTIGNLLQGGFTLQQALTILEDQDLNPTLSFVAADIETKVIYGESLSSSVGLSEWFSPEFKNYIKHGENSGYLGRELLIYCELLEERIESLIKMSVSILQPLLFIVIALCIVAAYLSILLPMYQIIEII